MNTHDDMTFYFAVGMTIIVFFVIFLPMYLIEITDALVYVFERVSRVQDVIKDRSDEKK